MAPIWNISRILVLLLFVFELHASEPDSLIQVIKANLSKHEAELMIGNAAQLLTVSKADHNQTYQLEALKFLGIAMHLEAKYDSAIAYYNKAIAISQSSGDSLNTGKLFLNLATSYNSKGNFEEAIENALKSEMFFEKLKDFNGQARVQNLLGIFYFNKNEFDQAFHYFEKYHKLAIASQDSGEIVSSMNNMASTMDKLGQYERERQLLKQSIAIQEARGQKIRIGSAYENLGSLYVETDSLQLAHLYYLKAKEAYEANQSTYDLARLLLNTGRLKMHLHHPQQALADFQQALQYSKEGGFLKLQEEALFKIAGWYDDQHNYQKALAAFKKYIDIKDSVLNEENQASINKLMVQFDTEKKERQIASQKLVIANKTIESRRKSSIIAGLVGLIIILVLLASIIYSRIKIRQERRMNEERVQIQQQRMMAIIESQEHERKRFTADLHDSFGQLISILKINISELADAASKNSFSKMEKFHECKRVINDMYQELRNVVFDLLPQALVSGGLEPALKEFTSRLNRSGKIRVEVLCYDLENLTKDAEVALYRICQEWINNILKYSDATSITIQLTANDNELTLTIEDNGFGFDKNKLIYSKGNGWKNMNSRAGIFHGELDIETMPDIRGNLLILNIPKKEVQGKEKKIPA